MKTENNKTFSKLSILLFSLYICIWISNPENKLIVLLLILLIFSFVQMTRNLRLGLLLGYIASLLVATGKTYELQLIPPGFYPFSTEWWPNEYGEKLIITPGHIIAGLLILVILRDFFSHERKLFRKQLSIEITVLITYIIWTFLSSIFGSSIPVYSFSAFILGLPIFIAILYAYLYKYSNVIKQVIPIFLFSFVAFESLIALQQFVMRSPVGKTIESQLTIEDFGQAVDEYGLGFRPVGTFSHANILGGFLAISLPILIAHAVSNPSKVKLGIISITLIVLILTLSRSAWLALFFELTLFIWHARKQFLGKLSRFSVKPLTVIFPVSFLLLISLVFPRIEKTVYSFSDVGGGGHIRLLQIIDSLSIITLHPLFGVGLLMSVPETLSLNPSGVFSTFPSVVHNAYLLKASETGIPSLLLFLSLIGLCWYKLHLVQQNAGVTFENRITSVALQSTLIGSLVFGLLQPAF